MMVWGVARPRGLGDFFPDGDFEGWSSSLTSYYLKQPPEIQRALFSCPPDPEVQPDQQHYVAALDYPFYVAKKFMDEVGTKLRPDDFPITPVQPHEAPTSFVTVKSYKALGSLIQLNSGLLAVDDVLKTIIERLEPQVHQFFPIKIVMPKDNIYPVQYHTLVFGQYYDSFVPEMCKEGASWPSGPSRPYSDDSKQAISGRAFSKKKFGNAHLWREREFRQRLTCFSNELQCEIESASLLMPKCYRMIEV
jgi:hypothetical protein